MIIYLAIMKIKFTVIKIYDSESRGQEEAAIRDERVSYLQVRSTAQKFADAVTKPP